MKKEYIINLNDVNDLRQFTTDILYKIENDVDAIYERYVIDAKSLLGLMTISAHDIKVLIHSNNETELELFRQICERYEVIK